MVKWTIPWNQRGVISQLVWHLKQKFVPYEVLALQGRVVGKNPTVRKWPPPLYDFSLSLDHLSTMDAMPLVFSNYKNAPTKVNQPAQTNPGYDGMTFLVDCNHFYHGSQLHGTWGRIDNAQAAIRVNLIFIINIKTLITAICWLMNFCTKCQFSNTFLEQKIFISHGQMLSEHHLSKRSNSKVDYMLHYEIVFDNYFNVLGEIIIIISLICI